MIGNIKSGDWYQSYLQLWLDQKKETKMKANDLSTFLPLIRGSIVQKGVLMWCQAYLKCVVSSRRHKKRKENHLQTSLISGYETQTHANWATQRQPQPQPQPQLVWFPRQ